MPTDCHAAALPWTCSSVLLRPFKALLARALQSALAEPAPAPAPTQAGPSPAVLPPAAPFKPQLSSPSVGEEAQITGSRWLPPPMVQSKQGPLEICAGSLRRQLAARAGGQRQWAGQWQPAAGC